MLVGEEDHWLPPDNYQEDPEQHGAYARHHRTLAAAAYRLSPLMISAFPSFRSDSSSAPSSNSLSLPWKNFRGFRGHFG